MIINEEQRLVSKQVMGEYTVCCVQGRKRPWQLSKNGVVIDHYEHEKDILELICVNQN